MINRDAVVILMCATHALIFLLLLVLTNTENLAFISGNAVVLWSVVLVLSKKISKINEWYEKPFKL